MLDKIFPVLEDMCSSRAVEQFRSIPGLFSHCSVLLSRVSLGKRTRGGGIWWYSWPKRVWFESPESFLQPLWPKDLGEETPCGTKH